MSQNKFLSGSSGGLEELTTGTFDLNVGSATIQSLAPDLPVLTNSSKTLISGFIPATSISPPVITSPFIGTLIVSDLETDDYLSINAQLNLTDNILSATQLPDVTTFSNAIRADSLQDPTSGVSINLTNTTIDLTGTNILANGSEITTTANIGSVINNNELLVSPSDGDDGTGVRGESNFPFKTLKGAYDAASDGDVVLCMTGNLGNAAYTHIKSVSVKAWTAGDTDFNKPEVNHSITFQLNNGQVSLSGISFNGLTFTDLDFPISFTNCQIKGGTNFNAGTYTNNASFYNCSLNDNINLNADTTTTFNNCSSLPLCGFSISLGSLIINNSVLCGHISQTGGNVFVNNVLRWYKDGSNRAIHSNITTGVANAYQLMVKNCTFLDEDFLTAIALELVGTTSVVFGLYNCQVEDIDLVLTGAHIKQNYLTQGNESYKNIGDTFSLEGSGAVEIKNATTCDITPTGVLTLKAHTTTGQMNMSNSRIVVLADPVNGQDGANKQYVDGAIPSLNDLETKTQNIDLTTIAGTTDITGNIDLTGILDATGYEFKGQTANIPYEDTSATNTNMGTNMTAITTGLNNTVYGRVNGTLIADGSGNTSVGYFNLLNNASGNNNTALGSQNCLNVKGNNNIGIGVANNAFAPAVPANATASDNIGIGFATLRNVEGSPHNIAIGNSANFNLISGTGENVSVGRSANVTGTTLEMGTAVGGLADCANFNNSTCIGYASTATKANQITMGNGNVTEIVPESVGLCDLGSSTRPFKDIWADGTVDAGDYKLSGDQGYLPISTLTEELKSGTNFALATGIRNISYGIDNANLATTANSNTIIGRDNCQNGNPSFATILGLNNANYCLAGNVAIGSSNLSLSPATPANCLASGNIIIGSGNAQKIEDSDSNIVIGNNSFTTHISNPNGRNIIIGNSSGLTNTDKNDSVIIGFNSQSNFDNNIVLGDNIIGTKTQQIMLGSSNITEIVNEGDNVCDLGSATNQFKDIYLGGMLLPSANLLVVAGGIYIGARPVVSSGYIQTNNTTVANTAVETDLISSIVSVGVGSLASAANSAKVGTHTQINLSGNFDNAGGAAANNCTVRIKLGTQTINTLVLDTDAVAAGAPWRINGEYTVTAIGAAGNIKSNVYFEYMDAAVGKTQMNNVAVQVIDTTVIQDLSITCQWATADVSNTITANQFCSTLFYHPM